MVPTGVFKTVPLLYLYVALAAINGCSPITPVSYTHLTLPTTERV